MAHAVTVFPKGMGSAGEAVVGIWPSAGRVGMDLAAMGGGMDLVAGIVSVMGAEKGAEAMGLVAGTVVDGPVTTPAFGIRRNSAGR